MSFAALRGLAREVHLFVPSIALLVFVRDFEPTVLRIVNGLWCMTDDTVVDMVWRYA